MAIIKKDSKNSTQNLCIPFTCAAAFPPIRNRLPDHPQGQAPPLHLIPWAGLVCPAFFNVNINTTLLLVSRPIGKAKAEKKREHSEKS
jgi:hypothetical protein